MYAKLLMSRRIKSEALPTFLKIPRNSLISFPYMLYFIFRVEILYRKKMLLNNSHFEKCSISSLSLFLKRISLTLILLNVERWKIN